VQRQKIEKVSISCGTAPQTVAAPLRTIVELTEWYGTYFFMHRQFACVKIFAEHCIALCYGAERDG